MKLFKRNKDADGNDVVLDASNPEIIAAIKDSDDFASLRAEIRTEIQTEVDNDNVAYLAEKEQELSDNFVQELAKKDVNTVNVNGRDIAVANLMKKHK